MHIPLSYWLHTHTSFLLARMHIVLIGSHAHTSFLLVPSRIGTPVSIPCGPKLCADWLNSTPSTTGCLRVRAFFVVVNVRFDWITRFDWIIAIPRGYRLACSPIVYCVCTLCDLLTNQLKQRSGYVGLLARHLRHCAHACMRRHCHRQDTSMLTL